MSTRAPPSLLSQPVMLRCSCSFAVLSLGCLPFGTTTGSVAQRGPWSATSSETNRSAMWWVGGALGAHRMSGHAPSCLLSGRYMDGPWPAAGGRRRRGMRQLWCGGK